MTVGDARTVGRCSWEPRDVLSLSRLHGRQAAARSTVGTMKIHSMICVGGDGQPVFTMMKDVCQ